MRRLALLPLTSIAAVTVLLLGCAPASSAGDTTVPCARTSTTEVAGRTVATCERFHPTVAVRLPADTSDVVYGVVAFNGITPSGVTTRSGRTIPLAAGADTSAIEPMASRGYVRARIDSGSVVAVSAYLVISQRAVVLAYAGTTLRGTVMILDDARTTEQTAIRFARGAGAGGVVHGRILNYDRAVTIGSTRLPRLVTARTRSAYLPIFGTYPAVTLTWNPAMHTATDSEVVMTGSVGPSYMSTGPHLGDLLAGPWSPREVTFMIHGSPMGVPAIFEGRLVG